MSQETPALKITAPISSEQGGCGSVIELAHPRLHLKIDDGPRQVTFYITSPYPHLDICLNGQDMGHHST